MACCFEQRREGAVLYILPARQRKRVTAAGLSSEDCFGAGHAVLPVSARPAAPASPTRKAEPAQRSKERRKDRRDAATRKRKERWLLLGVGGKNDAQSDVNADETTFDCGAATVAHVQPLRASLRGAGMRLR